MSKVIIFRCKNCNEIIFACAKEPDILKDSKKEINQYLIEGHKIEEVDTDEVRVSLGMCRCSNEQKELFKKETS